MVGKRTRNEYFLLSSFNLLNKQPDVLSIIKYDDILLLYVASPLEVSITTMFLIFFYAIHGQ